MTTVPLPPNDDSDPGQARARLEEEGFEALQRLYAESLSETTEGAVCARLLLGLYNGQRFPFDLTDLRLLPAAEFTDAMRLIAMDARLTRQEVHEYFQAGSRKFEDLVRQHDVTDVVRLREQGDGTPTPRPQRGTLRDQDYVSAKLVTYGSAPGYRDVSLTFDCEVVGLDRAAVGPVRLKLSLPPADGVRVMEHVQEVHAFAWSKPERGPLDLAANEMRPAWLDVRQQGTGTATDEASLARPAPLSFPSPDVPHGSLADPQVLEAFEKLLPKADPSGDGFVVVMEAIQDLTRRIGKRS